MDSIPTWLYPNRPNPSNDEYLDERFLSWRSFWVGLLGSRMKGLFLPGICNQRKGSLRDPRWMPTIITGFFSWKLVKISWTFALMLIMLISLVSVCTFILLFALIIIVFIILIFLFILRYNALIISYLFYINYLT